MKATELMDQRQAQATSNSRQPGPCPTLKPGSAQSGAPRKPIRVMIVDDHAVVRKGLSLILAKCKALAVVAEAADGLEALTKARQLSPDVVVVDIDLPRLDGLTLAEILHSERPEIKVLFLSMHGVERYGLRIIQSGARGFLSKDAVPLAIAEAITIVAAGRSNFGPNLAQAVLNQWVQGKAPDRTMSGREREVVVGVAQGLSNKEIACHLGIGVRTVETHREQIMRKLDIHTIAGLTKFAIRQGLVHLAQ